MSRLDLHAGTALGILVIGGWLGAAAVANGRTWTAAIVFGLTLLVLIGARSRKT